MVKIQWAQNDDLICDSESTVMQSFLFAYKTIRTLNGSFMLMWKYKKTSKIIMSAEIKQLYLCGVDKILRAIQYVSYRLLIVIILMSQEEKFRVHKVDQLNFSYN